MDLYILRLLIKNFRNFKAIDLHFSSSAVVVGENKVGKSNLLHALRLVLDASLPDSARMLRPEDFFDGLKDPLKGETIEVDVELSSFENNEGAKAVLFSYLVKQKPITARLAYKFRPKQNIGGNPSVIEDYEFVLVGGLEDTPFGYQVRNYVGFVVLPALRDAEGELANWRRSPLRRLLDGLQLPAKKIQKISASLDLVTREMLKIPAIGNLAAAIKTQTNNMVGDIHGTEPSLGCVADAFSTRHSWDDLIKIGEEDVPLFCRQNNVYVAFLFTDYDKSERQDNDLDTLKNVTIYHELEGCL